MRSLSLFLSTYLPVCLSIFLFGVATVVNENLKSFRSPLWDRWKRRRCWFPNGVSPVYKSTPRVCLVRVRCERCSAVVYFWVTREDSAKRKFCVVELKRRLRLRSRDGKQRSFIWFMGRFSRRDHHFYGAGNTSAIMRRTAAFISGSCRRL